MANYLYNGVELPALPEWDKETYPYAIITEATTGSYYFRVYDEVPYYDETNLDNSGNPCLSFADGSAKQKNWLTAGADDEWGLNTAVAVTASRIVSSGIVWTNTDTYCADGTTLWLAASTPIPCTSLDPTSLLQGYLVGRRLASLRGKVTYILTVDESGILSKAGSAFIVDENGILTL